MINATVTGKLGRDPETRQTKSGKVMTRFSVASSQKKGQDYQTTWVEVLCFDEMADMCFEKLHKGDRVVVNGKMNLDQYEKKDGTQGCSLALMADDVGISLRFGPKVAVSSDDSIPSGW